MVKERCFAEIQRLKQDTILASISAPHFVLQREPRRAAELIAQFVQGTAELEYLRQAKRKRALQGCNHAEG
jgi:hypothetical protein